MILINTRAMKKIYVAIFISIVPLMHMEAQSKISKVKWEETYTFDKCNTFRIDFYAKNNELMRTADCKTYFQSQGKPLQRSASDPHIGRRRKLLYAGKSG